jgi:hypothetical protein
LTGTYPDLDALVGAIAAGLPSPDAVLLSVGDPSPTGIVAQAETVAGDPALPAAAHDAIHRVLALVQRWLADERLADVRLAFLTRGAVSAASE